MISIFHKCSVFDNIYVVKGNEAGACAAPETRTRAVSVRDLNRRKSA